MALLTDATIEEKQEAFRVANKNRMKGTLAQLKQTMLELMNNHWTDTSPRGGLTVQQKLDSYGADVLQLFQLADALGTFIHTIDASYIPPTPTTFGYTANIDPQAGTVTAVKNT